MTLRPITAAFATVLVGCRATGDDERRILGEAPTIVVDAALPPEAAAVAASPDANSGADFHGLDDSTLPQHPAGKVDLGPLSFAPPGSWSSAFDRPILAQRLQDVFATCYRRALAEGSHARGTMRTTWQVASSGSISSVRITQASWVPESLQVCIRGRGATVQLLRPARGATVLDVSVTLAEVRRDGGSP